MKKLLLSLIASLSACVLAAGDSVVFLSCSDSSPASSGAYSGARAAAKTIGDKYGKKVSVRYESVPRDADAISAALSKAYVGGAKGAAIFLAEDLSSKKLSEAIDSLNGRGFPVSVAGAQVLGAKPFSSAATDAVKARSALDSEIRRLGGSEKIPLFCVRVKDSPSGVLGPGGIERFLKAHSALKDVQTAHYSVYAAENAVEIMRFDTYGLLIFDASALSDMAPIAPDSDRKFAVCADGAPYLVYYFANGFLDSCVFEDYFGFGYCVLRDICENIYSEAVPNPSRTLIAPLVFKREDSEKFSELWKEWMRR